MAGKYASKMRLSGGVAAGMVTVLMSCLLTNNSFADNTNLNLGVNEVLSVSLTPTSTDATGDTGELVVNQVGLSVVSNNGAGFVAYMTTKTDTTALTSSIFNYTIPTLADNTSWTRSSGVTNFWGWSLDDITYRPMAGVSSTPIKITSNSAASNTASAETVYFGAKIDSSKPSGTYSNTVVFTVISGIDTVPVPDPTDPSDPSDPTDPSNPAGPQDTTEDDQTVYTYTSNGTTTTEITQGDNRSKYPNSTEVIYTPPQGVTTYASINEGAPFAIGLTVIACIAATAGIFFLIAAKRKKDDDEEEKEY